MGNFIVISSNEISDLNKPIFKIEENKEVDIKKMIEDNQEFIIDYMRTGYMEVPQCNDISTSRSARNKYNNFIKNFVSSINRVEVIKGDDGKYISTNNKTILYLVKKYDLKILVYVP